MSASALVTSEKATMAAFDQADLDSRLVEALPWAHIQSGPFRLRHGRVSTKQIVECDLTPTAREHHFRRRLLSRQIVALHICRSPANESFIMIVPTAADYQKRQIVSRWTSASEVEYPSQDGKECLVRASPANRLRCC